MFQKNEVDIKERSATIRLNSKIYPLQVVISSSYAFVDRAFILLDGDPQGELIVNLEPKDDNPDVKAAVDDFLCELLNYLAYYAQRSENQEIRRILLERALSTNK